jgi:hypothetical protein
LILFPLFFSEITPNSTDFISFRSDESPMLQRISSTAPTKTSTKAESKSRSAAGSFISRQSAPSSASSETVVEEDFLTRQKALWRKQLEHMGKDSFVEHVTPSLLTGPHEHARCQLVKMVTKCETTCQSF